MTDFTYWIELSAHDAAYVVWVSVWGASRKRTDSVVCRGLTRTDALATAARLRKIDHSPANVQRIIDAA